MIYIHLLRAAWPIVCLGAAAFMIIVSDVAELVYFITGASTLAVIRWGVPRGWDAGRSALRIARTRPKSGESREIDWMEDVLGVHALSIDEKAAVRDRLTAEIKAARRRK